MDDRFAAAHRAVFHFSPQDNAMRQHQATTQFHQALSDELQSYFRPGLPNRGTATVARNQDQVPDETMQQMELDLQMSDAAIAQWFKAGFGLA